MASRTFVRALSSSASKHAAQKPPHLLSLADLTVPEIGTLLESAHRLKKNYSENRIPLQASQFGHSKETELLKGRSVAILMSKRSTRTRVASESATALLGMCHVYDTTLYLANLLLITHRWTRNVPRVARHPARCKRVSA